MKLIHCLAILGLVCCSTVRCYVDDDDCYDHYVQPIKPKCPPCNIATACPTPGCDCTDCDGDLLTPPPKPPLPKGCPACHIECPQIKIRCPPPTTDCTDKQLDTYVYKCPDCVPEAGCQRIGCDCLDCDGNLLTPPKYPAQLPRPDGCPACVQKCPINNIRCKAPSKCSDKQMDTYVPKCPDCVPQAGCKQIGCDCKDCDGNLLTPPTNPPQPPRPDGCPDCPKDCILAKIKCAAPKECTDDQFDRYVNKCPGCIPEAGCQRIGCDCLDCHGNLLTPPNYPAQLPRPDGCPACVQKCPINNIRCKAPSQCSDTQLNTYVPKCPDCVPQAGCKQIGCDCKDCDGNLLTPPNHPPQPPRPDGCPACNTVCIQSKIKCPPPGECTEDQLDYYVDKCPTCVLNAGCKQIGCDCKDCDGNILTPPNNPPQPPRPDGCPGCATVCPDIKIKCVAPPQECTDKQLNTYILKCPPCNAETACQPPGCDCTDCDGELLTPPPKPPLPKGCPPCRFSCPLIKVDCPPPTTECTDKQLDTYIYKCPECVAQAGCKQIGCDCKDCDGTLLTPPTNPPQPPRPDGCPACSTACIQSKIKCPPPGECSDDQLDYYVPKCPPCVKYAGCKQIGCDCKDAKGNLLTTPTNPPQPPRPDGCPACSTKCPDIKINCISPTGTCTATELAKYVPKCPECTVKRACPQPICDCTDCDGNLLTEPPLPPLPPGCPKCVMPCPLYIIKCPPPTTQCSATQLAVYVPKCPPCNAATACQKPACDCTDCDGNLLTAPPKPPLPIGCKPCIFHCPLIVSDCPAPTTQCTDTQLAVYVPKCPTCELFAGCPNAGCDCTDPDGNIREPAPKPPLPPRPEGCPACVYNCPKILILCPAPSIKCTPQQLTSYVIKCPACVAQAGCKQIGCDCEDCDGTLLTPPTNPPQPRRPDGCPKCTTVCIQSRIKCAAPTECTDDQLDYYVPKCPDCVLNAGCKQIGCDCKDCDGNLLTPPNNPPQPPRPDGCPTCSTVCPEVKIKCPAPKECTDKQLTVYVPKCPQCVAQAGCQQVGCDCKDCDGNLLTPPTNPPQPPRPEGCPKCSTVCIQSLIKCAAPTTCTADQLKKYVPKCPDCIPQAGCQQLGCECYDCDGYSYVPPWNPPQPKRPPGCPKCPQNCIIPFVPCGKPTPCTKQQLKTYVPNPDSDYCDADGDY